MRGSRRLVLAAIAVFLLPGAAPVGAQDRAVCVSESLGPQVRTALLRHVQRARDAGIPPRLVCRKINEGVSKRVPGRRLVTGTAGFVDALIVAREAAGPRASPEVLASAVDAVERGVPPQRVRAFLQANPNPRRSVVGLRVLAEFTEAGIPADAAARAVNAGLDRGMRGERLLAFSAAVRRRIRQGEAPPAALRAELEGRNPVEGRRRRN